LIADTTNDRVIEVAPAGKIVFSTDDWGGGSGKLSDGTRLRYPNDAHELPNGNLLVTDRNNDRAVEVSRDGAVVWQYAGKVKHPHNADRLPNGNTIICDSDSQYVREVNPAGEVVWSYGDGSRSTLHWPRDADRLENGNTLITDSKNRRVFEVTPDGRKVWEFRTEYFSNFYDADRLTGGNTLMSGQQHQEVIEVNAAGERVWEFRNYRRAHPINAKLSNGNFAKLDASGAPAEWVLARRLSEGGGELVWTTNPAGKRCPGLSFDREGALCLQQTIAVKPGKAYQVTGTIKAEGVEALAFLQMAFLDDKNGLLRDVIEAPKGELLSGTSGWQRDFFGTAAPPGAAAAEVRLFITGRGRVFADEIAVSCP
jgi:hypothetical protein